MVKHGEAPYLDSFVGGMADKRLTYKGLIQ